MKRIAVLILAMLVPVVAAGCTSEQAAPSATQAAATTQPTPQPTEAPTEEPTAEPTEDDGSETALADMIPDELNGVPGTDLPQMEEMLGPALAAQGIDASEMEFAFTTYGEGTDAVVLTAFRIPESDDASLEMLARMMAGAQTETGVTTEELSIGGKSVLRISGEESGAAYLYFAGDAAFTIVSESPDLAEQLLAELP